MPYDRREFLGSAARRAAAGLTTMELAAAQSGAGGLAGVELAAAPPAAAADGKLPAGPADPERKLEPTGGNLGSLFPVVQQLAGTAEFPWSFLSGRFAAFEEFRRAAREKAFELLCYRPPPVEPRAELLEEVDCGSYVRQRIVFSTTPWFRVPAYLLLPKNRVGRGPAIVDLHSHGGMFLFGKEKVVDLGQNHPVMVGYHERNYDGRPTATALASRGYVVLSIDAFMFGERRLLLDEDLKYGWDRSRYSQADADHLNRQCRGKETTLAKSLAFAGASWPGVVFWDDIRSVDYLCSRSDVDPERIGCLGISMGGYRAAWLAGLEPRIKAAVVVGFMSTVRPMLHRHIDTHSWVHFLAGLHHYLDLPDVVSLRAPAALLVQQCAQDGLFTPGGMRESVDKLAAIYDKLGARDRFEGRFYDVPHKFTRPMQDDAFAWLDRQLK